MTQATEQLSDIKLVDIGSKFSIPEAVKFNRTSSGLLEAELSYRNLSTAKVFIFGAHVSSWSRRGIGEALYMSPTADLSGNGPIRGGIPIVWPVFGKVDGFDLHGFARTQNWEVRETGKRSDGATFIKLGLATTPENAQASWPHDFDLQYQITLSESLECRLTVTNLGLDDFKIQAAFHNYFRANNPITKVVGLENSDFYDLKTKEEAKSDNFPVHINGETRRGYFNVSQREASIVGDGQIISLYSDLPERVLWNNGNLEFPDLAPSESTKFVCLEAATTRNPLIVKAGSEVVLAQTIILRKAN